VNPAPSYASTMRVEVGPDAAGFVPPAGGRLRVWAAVPRVCCGGTPARLRATTGPPPDTTGFLAVPVDGLDLYFRGLAGGGPDVLGIALRGRRRPHLDALWEGCAVVL
jgi:hypothetical protein